MKKTHLIAVFVFLVLGFGSFYIFRKPSTVEQTYKFTRLDKDVAAKTDEYTVPFSAVLDEHYMSLYEQQQELQLLAILEQWTNERTKNISVGMHAPKRTLLAICSQYAVRCNLKISVAFDSEQKEFVLVDGKERKLHDLQLQSVQYLAARTQILNYLIEKINANLRMQVLLRLSGKEKKPVQDIIENQIISEKKLRLESEKRWVNFVKVIPHASRMTEEEKKAVFQSLQDRLKNEEIDRYVQKHVLRLPISVNIERPKTQFDVRWDWTPYLGPTPNKNIQFVAFCDFFSSSCRHLLSSYPNLSEAWPNVTFGFRPHFQNEDRFQLMISEMSMCVWLKAPKNFWPFIQEISLIERRNIEKNMYEALEKVQAPIENLKQCFLQRKTEAAVRYHIDTAGFYHIINSPVIFVGQEVYVGPIEGDNLMNLIRRQTL
jgi:hypothetical protein